MGLKSIKAINLEKVRKQLSPEISTKENFDILSLINASRERKLEDEKILAAILPLLADLSMGRALNLLVEARARLMEKVQVKL